jgi:hypothetical protein
VTDQQRDAIRQQQLRLIGTILSGDLHVRTPEGIDLLLDEAGELQPFELERGRRIPLTEL